MTYLGLRPGEKLYEEKLMAEEGLKKTPNDLIHIGCPIPFEVEGFLKHLQSLMEMAYANRSLIDEKCRGQIISYYVKDIANNRDPKKVLKYIGFFHFVKKNIVKNKYEKIVLLDTSAGTAALLAGFLSKHYRNKYWIGHQSLDYITLLKRVWIAEN